MDDNNNNSSNNDNNNNNDNRQKITKQIELNDIPENARLFFDKHSMVTVHTLR